MTTKKLLGAFSASLLIAGMLVGVGVEEAQASSTCAQTTSGLTSTAVAVSSASSGRFCVLTITAGTGTWTVPAGVGAWEVLVVGGGGGGGADAGGGGGGGGVRAVTYNYQISHGPLNPVAITVGAGGARGVHTANDARFPGEVTGAATAGGISTVVVQSATGNTERFRVTAGGGQPGQTNSGTGATGGAVGTTAQATGSFQSPTGIIPSTGTGPSGSGGAGGLATGGAGVAGGGGVTFTGLNGGWTAAVGGGGGGGAGLAAASHAGGTGGTGGGGAGASGGATEIATTFAAPGTANTGGGGGGGARNGTASLVTIAGVSDYSRNGAAGGSGAVIIRYEISPYNVQVTSNASTTETNAPLTLTISFQCNSSTLPPLGSGNISVFAQSSPAGSAPLPSFASFANQTRTRTGSTISVTGLWTPTSDGAYILGANVGRDNCPGGNPSGNFFSDAAVGLALTVTDGQPPLVSAAVLAANGTSLTLTFNEGMASATAPAGLGVMVGGSAVAFTAGNLALRGTSLILTLASPAIQGAAVTLSYDGSGTLRDDSLTPNNLAAFSSRVVTNNSSSVPTFPITISSGTLGQGSNVSLVKTQSQTLTLPSSVSNGVPLFTRAGHTIVGWSTTDGGSQTHALSGAFTTDAATTLFPVWLGNSYSVLIQAGANATGGNQQLTKNFGQALTLPDSVNANLNFTRAGHTVAGWSTTNGGSKSFELAGAFLIELATVLFPFWLADTFTVTIEPGQSGIGTSQILVKTFGTALELPTADQAKGLFSRTGYSIVGWAETDGGIQVFALGASYLADSAVTLFPVWTLNATEDEFALTFSGPLVAKASNRVFLQGNEMIITLQGKRLHWIQSVKIGGQSLEVLSVTREVLVVRLPVLDVGRHSLALETKSGTLLMRNFVTVRAN